MNPSSMCGFGLGSVNGTSKQSYKYLNWVILNLTEVEYLAKPLEYGGESLPFEARLAFPGG